MVLFLQEVTIMAVYITSKVPKKYQVNWSISLIENASCCSLPTTWLDFLCYFCLSLFFETTLATLTAIYYMASVCTLSNKNRVYCCSSLHQLLSEARIC